MAILHNGKRITSLRIERPGSSDGTVEDLKLQSKSVTPSLEEQVVVSDDGYDGLSQVIVEAMSEAEQAEPSISVSPSGLITAEVRHEEGYVVDGTKTATLQLDTQAEKTVTPTKAEQVVVEGNRYTTGPIKIDAIPEEYIIPEGTISITTNGEHDVTQYQTVSVDVQPETAAEDLDAEIAAQDAAIADQVSLIAEIVEALEEGGNVVSGTIEITENGTHNVSAFATAEVNVPSGEPILQNKTVTPSTVVQTISADNGYDGLDTVTVSAMPTAAQATPSISIDGSGLITATATQSAGYVEEGTKTATQQLTTKGAATIVPGTSNQTIASGTYLTGTQTIKGDANLKAENIASGVSIFGVSGNLAAGSQVAKGTISLASPANKFALTFNVGFSVSALMFSYVDDNFHNAVFGYYIDGVAKVQVPIAYAEFTATVTKTSTSITLTVNGYNPGSTTRSYNYIAVS